LIDRAPFAPTPSEGHGAQDASKSAKRRRSYSQLTLASEHSEELPFDAAEHCGTLSSRAWSKAKSLERPFDAELSTRDRRELLAFVDTLTPIVGRFLVHSPQTTLGGHIAMTEDKVEFAVTRQRWRENWLRSIEELANINVQHSTWLNPHPTNLHYTFVEYVECYDDLIFHGYAPCVSAGLLSEDEANAAMELHRLLEDYAPPNGDAYDHEAILGDPAWQAVGASAAVTRERLERMIVDPAERKALLEISIYAQRASA
jgi:hypothetical protein